MGCLQMQGGGFSKYGYLRSDLTMLVLHPLVQSSKALELLEKQTANEHHKIAVVREEEFVQVMKGQQYNIYQHLDQVVSDQSGETQLHCQHNNFVWEAKYSHLRPSWQCNWSREKKNPGYHLDSYTLFNIGSWNGHGLTYNIIQQL